MVACLALSQMYCIHDGDDEDSGPPVVAIVTRIAPSSSLKKGLNRSRQPNRVRTASHSIDDSAVECNGETQDGRSRLKSLCLLRC